MGNTRRSKGLREDEGSNLAVSALKTIVLQLIEQSERSQLTKLTATANANKPMAIAKLPRLYDAGGDLSRDWQVQYYYRDPNTGKFKRFRVLTGLSKIRSEVLSKLSPEQKEQLKKERYAQAEKLMQDLRKKLKAGFNPFKNHNVLTEEDIGKRSAKATKKTVESYLREAAAIRMNGRSAGTLKNYNRFLLNFIEYLQKKNLNALPITAIDHGHVERFLASIIKDNAASNKWRNEHLSFLRGCWKELMRLYPNRVTQNPFGLSEKLKHTRTKSPVFTNDLRKLVRKELPKFDKQLWLFIQFIYYTGLRPGAELRLLQLRMFDFHQGTILVPAEITKDRTDRVVTMPRQLIDELAKLKAETLPKEFFLFTELNKPGPRPMSATVFQRRWTAFKQKHNIPAEYKMYAFKHTGATAADRSGIDRREIKEQLGHSSLQQTEEYLETWENKVSESIRDNFPTF